MIIPGFEATGPVPSSSNPLASLKEMVGPLMQQMAPMVENMLRPGPDGQSPFASLLGGNANGGNFDVAGMLQGMSSSLSTAAASSNPLDDLMGGLQTTAPATTGSTTLLITDDDAGLPGTLLPPHTADLISCDGDGYCAANPTA